MNKIQFAPLGLPILPKPAPPQVSENNFKNQIKQEQAVDKAQRGQPSKIEGSGPLPLLTDTEFAIKGSIIPEHTINRNQLVFNAQHGKDKKLLELYTKNYGIINPSYKTATTYKNPSIYTTANRTDILYNQSLGKLFNPSTLPNANILI